MKQINYIQKKQLHKNSLILEWTCQKTDYSAKITEIESKIPSINGLATTAALNAAENKIPDVSNLIKKQIMTKKCKQNINILQLLIIINLPKILLLIK